MTNFEITKMNVTINRNMPFTIKQIKKDIKCGLHSNFRICDILFYITIWKIMWKLQLYRSVYFYDLLLNIKHTQYIRCPLCILFCPKSKTLKKCDCRYN